MSIFDDMKRMVHGEEPLGDGLKYRKIDSQIVGDLVSESYVVCIVSHREYLEIVLRNLQDQTIFHCLHIYNPALVKMTSWKSGDDSTKYVIDPTKL